jgi:hypothetical protein
MSIHIDHSRAQSILEKAWSVVDEDIKPSHKMVEYINAIMRSKDVTYKYILVTGFLGKCVDGRVNARALQAGSSLAGAYDARSLCHDVVVGFEKSKVTFTRFSGHRG